MRRQAMKQDIAKENLLDDIKKTKLALETAYSNFENVSDPDLIDCYIYEVNSIHHKYKYLIRQVKQYELAGKV